MVVLAQPLVPEPESKEAFLVNDAGKVTRHRYARTELVRLAAPSSSGALKSKAFAFIFRCEVTGAERRYGLETVMSFASQKAIAQPQMAPAIDARRLAA